MSTVLEFPDIFPGWDPKQSSRHAAPELVLLQSDWTRRELAGPGPITANILQFVLEIDSDTYLFKMHLSGAAGNIPESVFCTVAWGETAIGYLRKEEEFYQRELEPVLGVAVPSVFGAFHGLLEGDFARVFIFQDCGVPCKGLGGLTEKQRLQLFDAVLSIHECGVEHGHLLAAMNIFLNEDGSALKVIDFRKAREHVCKYKPLFATPLEGEWSLTSPEDTGCDEMTELRAWLLMLPEPPAKRTSAELKVSKDPLASSVQ